MWSITHVLHSTALLCRVCVIARLVPVRFWRAGHGLVVTLGIIAGDGVALWLWGPRSKPSSSTWSNSLKNWYYFAASARKHVLMFPPYKNNTYSNLSAVIPDSKVYGANMGPTWVLSAPDGPHVGPMNFAIRDTYQCRPRGFPQSAVHWEFVHCPLCGRIYTCTHASVLWQLTRHSMSEEKCVEILICRIFV